MRKFALLSLFALSACGLSETAFVDSFETELERILVDVCEFPVDDTTDDDADEDEITCDTYDAAAAADCIAALKDITECTEDPLDIFADLDIDACADACIIEDTTEETDAADETDAAE